MLCFRFYTGLERIRIVRGSLKSGTVRKNESDPARNTCRAGFVAYSSYDLAFIPFRQNLHRVHTDPWFAVCRVCIMLDSGSITRCGQGTAR